MNAAKRKQKTRSMDRLASPLRPLVSQPGRRVMVGGFLAFVLLGGTYFGWQRWGDRIADQPQYAVLPENIEITPLPPWIRSDVKLEALRDGGLSDLSLLDRELTIEIAQAFSMHNWVQNVLRVSKHHPAHVDVQLEYRRPVAMVEVENGLLPIDAHGTLLPPGDFSAEQARDYLRISVAGAAPAGSIGTAWGAPRIHDASRIAGALQEHWKKLGLYRIAMAPMDNATDEPRFILATRQGARVIWGAAPRADHPADAKTAASKVARLMAYVEANGPLDGANQNSEIDLNQRELANPRNARLTSSGG